MVSVNFDTTHFFILFLNENNKEKKLHFLTNSMGKSFMKFLFYLEDY